jgi:hypothetical protein
MTTAIFITARNFEALDLSPVQTVLEDWMKRGVLIDQTQSIQFEIDYPQGPDTVELPEIDEIRLWFLRLDSRYPWLPYCLDWRSGELTRYAAMLVPHEFSERDGILYNPQALDLFVMQKIFTIHEWLRQQGIERTQLLKQMAELFGYELQDDLFDLLNQASAAT